MKKDDLPWMKWFWGDWFKCPEVRALKPETRCAWFEMLGLMWESTDRGYLTLNGKPYPMDCLSRCLGFAQANLEQSILEMELLGVFSRRDDGAIYNRRIVSDCELGEKRASAGKKGGICSSKTRSKLQASTQAKIKQDVIMTSDSDSYVLTKKNKRDKEKSGFAKDPRRQVFIDKFFKYYKDRMDMDYIVQNKDFPALKVFLSENESVTVDQMGLAVMGCYSDEIFHRSKLSIAYVLNNFNQLRQLASKDDV